MVLCGVCVHSVFCVYIYWACVLLDVCMHNIQFSKYEKCKEYILDSNCACVCSVHNTFIICLHSKITDSELIVLLLRLLMISFFCFVLSLIPSFYYLLLLWLLLLLLLLLAISFGFHTNYSVSLHHFFFVYITHDAAFHVTLKVISCWIHAWAYLFPMSFSYIACRTAFASIPCKMRIN